MQTARTSKRRRQHIKAKSVRHNEEAEGPPAPSSPPDELLSHSARRDRFFYKKDGKLYWPIEWEFVCGQGLPLGLFRRFRRTGDHEYLVKALRQFPLAVCSPIVADEIFHLRQLAHKITYKEIEDEQPRWAIGVHPDNLGYAPLDADTKRAARKVLHRLFDAMVGSALPGSSVSTPVSKSTRDARRRWNAEDVTLVKGIFDDLLAKIESLPEDRRKRRAHETPPAFKARVAALVQEIHLDPVVRQLAYPIYRVENCESEMMTAELAPLPADVADRVAQWATSNWNPRCISPKRLLYDLLAHYLDLTEDTIRGMIDRAEEKESATAS